MVEVAGSNSSGKLIRLRGSLALKFIVGVVIVGIFGAAGVSLLTARITASAMYAEFEAARDDITRLIATSSAGAMRWKKRDAVIDTYKGIAEAPEQPLEAIIAMSADGEFLAEFFRNGKKDRPSLTT